MSVTNEEESELNGESILANMIAESIKPFNPAGREFVTKYEKTSLVFSGAGKPGFCW